MFGSMIVDVALGLILTYLILSVVCSALGEYFATTLRWRAEMLEVTIRRMLPDRILLRSFFRHPLVRAQMNVKFSLLKRCYSCVTRRCRKSTRILGRMPTYLDEEQFAVVVADITVGNAARSNHHTLDDLEDALRRVKNRNARKALLTIMSNTSDEMRSDPSASAIPVKAFKIELRKWYSLTMKRLGGRYKRRIQMALVCIASVLVVSLNVDSIDIAKTLLADKQLRTAAASLAVEIADEQNAQTENIPPDGAQPSLAPRRDQGSVDSPATQPTDPSADLRREAEKWARLVATGIPIGWNHVELPAWELSRTTLLWWLLKLGGLFITVIAVSFGAPFWFELLGKVANMRGAGKKPVELDDEKRDQASLEQPLAAPAPAAFAAPAAPVAATKLFPPSKFGSIDHHTTEFRLDTARLLAHFAWLAYPPADAKCDADWKNFLLAETHARGFKECNVFSVRDTQGFVAADEANVVVAFRGTEKDKIGDWFTDLRMKQISGPFGGKVHGDKAHVDKVHIGFSDALDAVKVDLGKILADIKQGKRALWLTGHSLGAALATLQAARWLADEDRAIHGVYTFGSPRVGDDVFAEKYDALIKNRTFRFVNDKDIVTRVPPRRLNLGSFSCRYAHVGATMYFDSRGVLTRDPAAWLCWLNTALDILADQQQIANKLKAGASELFSDHSMDAYIRLLANVDSVR
jgi:triacylglycerol lipase